MKVISIGRNPENNIVVNDPTVSRTHCQIIQHDNGSYSIADFGSKNGTFVNGHRIQGEMPLQFGDTVTVGKSPVQWQGYFGGGMPPAGGYQPPYQGGPQSTNNSKGMITGIVVGLVIIAVVAVLAFTGVFSSKETANPRPDNTSGVTTNVPGVRPDRPNNTGATTNSKDTVKLVKEPVEKEENANFSGKWDWESPSKTNFGGEIVPCMTFHLNLKQTGDKLKGSYFSEDLGMGMMDYDDEPGGNPVSGTVKGNQVTVKLVSTAREGSATGTLTYKNANTIEWKAISVKGDVFGVIVPDKATLHRKK